VSLGASILSKYIGEEGDLCPLDGAVTLSNPLNLLSSKMLHQTTSNETRHTNSSSSSTNHQVPPKSTTPPTAEVGWGSQMFRQIIGNVYSRFFTKQLKNSIIRHEDQLSKNPDIDIPYLLDSTNLREFDGRGTVPMWGYKDVDDYLHDGSSIHHLPSVTIPLLLIHAMNDPVISRNVIPLQSPSPSVALLITEDGGHVGWCDAWFPFFSLTWGEKAAISFLEAIAHLHPHNQKKENDQEQKVRSKL